MNAADTLREAAKVLRRNVHGRWPRPYARALADVLRHEAHWADADPDYTYRPESILLTAAHHILRDAMGATGQPDTAGRPGGVSRAEPERRD
jgi:hypothetical protein